MDPSYAAAATANPAASRTGGRWRLRRGRELVEDGDIPQDEGGKRQCMDWEEVCALRLVW
jgi:hypothetical protein